VAKEAKRAKETFIIAMEGVDASWGFEDNLLNKRRSA
jgi:hypothetical protein